MRLWHTDLLPYLPKSQLIAQWRELNSIFAKEDKHILINYIYLYPKEDLYIYTIQVIEELTTRGVKIRTKDKMERYFESLNKEIEFYKPYSTHHDNEYLQICFFNLKEKYIRGQKDFNQQNFDNLVSFYEKTIK